MPKQSINTLKNWFKRGLKPLEAQFADWLDSFWHKDDIIPMDKVEDLTETLNTLGSIDESKIFYKDGTRAMEADVDMNNNYVKQVKNAVSPDQAPNYGQLLAAIDGRKPKDNVRAASTTDDVVHEGEQTLDTVALVDGDRFLDKDNANKAIRGIFIVRPGAWERAPDADTALELQGAEVIVDEGATNAGTSWYQYAIDITLEVTDLYWRQQGANAPQATSGTSGIMKLYTDLLAANTDGTVTQAIIKTVIDAINAALLLKDTIADREAAIDDLKDGVPGSHDTLRKLYEAIVGIGTLVGDYNASSNTLPTTGSGLSGAIDKGDYWHITHAGNIVGLGSLAVGDVLFARVANASTFADFYYLPFASLVADATNVVKGIMKLYTNVAASNTDGTVSQAGIVTALLAKLDLAGGSMTGALNESQGANIPSASTCDIGAATGNFVTITGTTNINLLGVVQAGTRRIVKFAGALTLINSGSLILPGAANITTVAGDIAQFVSLGSGAWVCIAYEPYTVTGSGATVKANAPTLVNPIVGTQAVSDYSDKAASTKFVKDVIDTSLQDAETVYSLYLFDNL